LVLASRTQYRWNSDELRAVAVQRVDAFAEKREQFLSHFLGGNSEASTLDRIFQVTPRNTVQSLRLIDRQSFVIGFDENFCRTISSSSTHFDYSLSFSLSLKLSASFFLV
jgi:hypothetical protein